MHKMLSRIFQESSKIFTKIVLVGGCYSYILYICMKTRSIRTMRVHTSPTSLRKALLYKNMYKLLLQIFKFSLKCFSRRVLPLHLLYLHQSRSIRRIHVHTSPPSQRNAVLYSPRLTPFHIDCRQLCERHPIIQTNNVKGSVMFLDAFNIMTIHLR